MFSVIRAATNDDLHYGLVYSIVYYLFVQCDIHMSSFAATIGLLID